MDVGHRGYRSYRNNSSRVAHCNSIVALGNEMVVDDEKMPTNSDCMIGRKRNQQSMVQIPQSSLEYDANYTNSKQNGKGVTSKKLYKAVVTTTNCKMNNVDQLAPVAVNQELKSANGYNKLWIIDILVRFNQGFMIECFYCSGGAV
jgi:hypothetical protein